ncbi:MAG: serine/threonine-protein kinase [Polyangiaceae bacterium]
MSVPDDSLAPGTVVSDRYRVEELLGQGAMGAVYRATHVHMRKRVALKVLLPELSGREDIVARFEREAMAAAHIEHPNVVAATDFGRLPNGAFFLVLEYVEGRSLREALAVERRFTPRRAARIGAQIASALARAHSLGIVHRDLKPDNVMLVRREGPATATASGALATSPPAEDDTVKVLDFGIAKVSAGMSPDGGKVLTQVGAVFGTPEYMAPEQAMGEAVDGRADLYALGVTLYEMLSGHRPFEADSPIVLLTKHVSEAPAPISVRAPEVSIPPALEALVMRLLAKKREERPATAEEVVTELAAFAAAPADGAPSEDRVRVVPTGTELRGPTASARTQADVSRAATVQSDPLLAAAPPKPLAIVRAAIPVLMKDRRRLGAVVAGGALLVLFLGWLALRPSHDRHGHVGTGADGGASTRDDGSWLKALAPKLSEARLKAAAKTGAPALVELEREFPDDPRVPRELVRAFMEGGKTAEAMAALGRLARIDAGAGVDDEMLRALDSLLDSPDPDVADGALAILEGPLGARGVDLIIEKAEQAKPGAARALSAQPEEAGRAGSRFAGGARGARSPRREDVPRAARSPRSRAYDRRRARPRGAHDLSAHARVRLLGNRRLLRMHARDDGARGLHRGAVRERADAAVLSALTRGRGHSNDRLRWKSAGLLAAASAVSSEMRPPL